MPKPTPKREIAVVQRNENEGISAFLVIHTGTEDAASWVRSSLPKLGKLHVVDNHRYHLYVQPEMYDIDVVVAYVENMG